jgi:hypothetical protein
MKLKEDKKSGNEKMAKNGRKLGNNRAWQRRRGKRTA